MPNHKVKQGECIESIARRYGLFWEKIWDHPNNKELKNKRSNSNSLLPDDIVFIPEKDLREQNAATGQKHRFRVKGTPSKLRLKLMDDDKTRAHENYVLDVDGELFSGTTNSEGWLEHSIPPGAKRGKLLVGEEQEEYFLAIGHLDPIDEATGFQARLNNLGFDCGKVDGVLGPKTIAALRTFQRACDLIVTGEPDDETLKMLKEEHGC